MCYGTPDVFDNVEEMASYEQLTDRVQELHLEDSIDSTLDLNPDHVHTHGDHDHAHNMGDTAHSHPNKPASSSQNRTDRHGPTLFADGGTAALEARIPSFDTDFDSLVENARYAVRTEDAKGQWGRSGNIPGYDLSEGDDVLLVIDKSYDDKVVNAFKEAFHKEGAAVVDTIDLHYPDKEIHTWWDECPGVTYPEDPLDESFLELESALTPDERLERGYRLERRYLTLEGFDEIDSDWWENIAREHGYDLLVYGIGGPTPLDVAERPYRYQRMPWRTKSSLASDAPTFPRDVWELIDRKTADIIKRAKEIRLTDPEGTDLRWTNYVTGTYPRKRPCHVLAHPVFPTSKTDTEGVIKGTTNHVNAFPDIEVEIEGAKVVDVNGGGEYGELWRETLEVAQEHDGIYGDLWEETYEEEKDEWADNLDSEAEYDYYDGSPGFFWLWECAIGTNPKYARPQGVDLKRLEFPLIERLRAGVVHMGMGTLPVVPVEQKAKERGLPWGHVHIHLLFPTLECEMPDGTTETVIEDGYLTVLDDPDVRSLAAEHGDPDEILSIDWKPDIPGISSDGDYNDYAKDPKDWISKQAQQSN